MMPRYILRVLLLVTAFIITRVSAQNCTQVVNASYSFLGVNKFVVPTENACKVPIEAHNEVCTQCASVTLPICNCPQGYMCDTGDAYPMCILCPEGFYCPHTGAADPLMCPAGYYCPLGAWFPLSCDALSLCPEGSSNYMPLWIALALGISLVICSLLLLIRPRQRVALPQAVASDELPAKKTVCTPVPSQAILTVSEPPTDLFAIEDSGVEKLELRFEDIYVSITPGLMRKPVTILNRVSGVVRPGEILAILGPSGAGKSTVLNVLRGRVEKTQGRLLCNNKRFNIAKLKKAIGFVPQADIMHRDMTVYEILRHNALARLPLSWSRKRKLAQVEDVLTELQLQEVRDCVIGDELHRGISGGQRKRVNIGIELVTNCSLLLLDEPTSGLDATVAEDCMKVIKRIASRGIGIALVVHQPRPEIWSMFDNVLVLAKGGQAAYFGPTFGAVPHFQSIGYTLTSYVSAPDYILDVVAGQWPCDLDAISSATTLQTWGNISPVQCASEGSLEQLPPSVGAIANKPKISFCMRKVVNLCYSFCIQFLLFFWQYVQQMTHGVHYFAGNILLFVLTGVYVGICFSQPKYRLPPAAQLARECPTAILQIYEGIAIDSGDDTKTANIRNFCSTCTPTIDQVGQMAFYMAMGLGVITSAMSVNTFGEMRKLVYWREASAGVNRLSYFLGRDIVDVIKCCLYAFSFTSAFVCLANPIGSFGAHFALSMSMEALALLYCVYAIGYIASILMSPTNASICAVIVTIVWMVTSGFVFRTQKLGALGSLSFPRWYGEGVFAAETSRLYSSSFEIVRVNGTDIVLQEASLWGGIAQYGDFRYGYTLNRFGTDLLIMVFLGIGLRSIAFMCLIWNRRAMQR